MPQNPGQQNFVAEAGTFDEEIRGNEIGTRWELAAGEMLRLAGEIGRSSIDTRVEEGPNFKGSQRALDSEETATTATGGASVAFLDGRIRVGGEGMFLREEAKETGLTGRTEVTSREVEVRGGFEWFVGESVALRGGVLRTVVDDDIDEPRTLRMGNGFTVGLGYLPRGGLVQLDAAVKIQSLDPDYDGDPRLEETRTSLRLGARLLL
jgi:hypothetical protein